MPKLRSTPLIGAALAVACLAGCVRAMPSTKASAAQGTVLADSQEITVLRDLLANWSRQPGGPCLDPNVATYPAQAIRTDLQRWDRDVLQDLLNNSRVAIDSTAGAVTSGTATCARSRTVTRLAFGRPRIAGDTGAVVFVASRLDARGNADTSMFVYRLGRAKGKWNVPGWLADSEITHSYVRGDGCYRFSHPEFILGIRIDTVVVHADVKSVGRSWRSTPAYHLSPGPASVGLGVPSPDQAGSWFVTHDSLHLQWSVVNSEVSVDLLVRGDSLNGVMRWETDAIVPDPPHVNVVGHRVACGKQ